jgi:hypothetical protein
VTQRLHVFDKTGKFRQLLPDLGVCHEGDLAPADFYQGRDKVKSQLSILLKNPLFSNVEKIVLPRQKKDALKCP